jgi:hypothetical protein
MSAVLKELPKPGPNPTIVDALEDALAQARRGELKSVVIVRVQTDGNTVHEIAGITNKWELIGHLDHINHMMHGLD